MEGVAKIKLLLFPLVHRVQRQRLNKFLKFVSLVKSAKFAEVDR